jgi:outer membrane protein
MSDTGESPRASLTSAPGSRPPGRAASLLGMLALSLLAAATPAAAQDASLQLTLQEAQARALETSHRLAEALARERAAAAAVDIRRAADRPLVSVSAGYTRTNHVTEFVVPSPTGEPRVLYPDVPGNYRTRVDLQWPIYNGGRSDALQRAARAEADAVTADLATVRADLRLEVARSFWAVVTARATVSVLERGVERAQAHVRDVRERLDAGLVPPNEVASAEAQESRQRMLLVEARGRHTIAVADLARLVADDAAVAVEPQATLDTAAPADSSLLDSLDTARASRSERVAFERRIEAALQSQRAAAAARRPTIAFAGGADYARPNPRIFPRADRWDDSWEASVNVSWPVWDGGRVQAEVAQATSLVTAAQRRLDQFDSALAVDVRQSTIELDTARAAVQAAADAVRAATEAHRVVGERYAAGVISQIEVLDAEFALLQAELDRTRAQANVRLAEARLERALGR